MRDDHSTTQSFSERSLYLFACWSKLTAFAEARLRRSLALAIRESRQKAPRCHSVAGGGGAAVATTGRLANFHSSLACLTHCVCVCDAGALRSFAGFVHHFDAVADFAGKTARVLSRDHDASHACALISETPPIRYSNEPTG